MQNLASARTASARRPQATSDHGAPESRVWWRIRVLATLRCQLPAGLARKHNPDAKFPRCADSPGRLSGYHPSSVEEPSGQPCLPPKCATKLFTFRHLTRLPLQNAAARRLPVVSWTSADLRFPTGERNSTWTGTAKTCEPTTVPMPTSSFTQSTGRVGRSIERQAEAPLPRGASAWAHHFPAATIADRRSGVCRPARPCFPSPSLFRFQNLPCSMFARDRGSRTRGTSAAVARCR